MPFVIRHQQSGQVWTCVMMNSYKLPYYGTKYWDWEDEAADQVSSFLESQGIADLNAWAILEVEESQLKRYNVKLKNDPRNTLYIDAEGQVEIRKQQA